MCFVWSCDFATFPSGGERLYEHCQRASFCSGALFEFLISVLSQAKREIVRILSARVVLLGLEFGERSRLDVGTVFRLSLLIAFTNSRSFSTAKPARLGRDDLV